MSVDNRMVDLLAQFAAPVLSLCLLALLLALSANSPFWQGQDSVPG